MLALGIICVLACFKYFTLVELSRAQEDFATVINKSGRQRMLSQRIALFSLELSEVKKHKGTREKLTAALNEFEQNHIDLINGSADARIPQLTDPYILDVYFSEPAELDQLVKNYIAAARNILASDTAQENIDYIMQTGPGILLENLNNIVKLHEENARDNVAKVTRLQRIYLLLTFIILLFEALFLFRPLVERIRNTIQRLQDRQEIIEDQHKELKHFTYIASHNLREPLRKINGFSQKLSAHLEQKNPDPVSTGTYLGMISSGAAQMNDIVEGLQSYAQTLSAVTDSPREIEATLALKNAIERQKTQIENSNAAISYDGLPVVRYNPQMLTQLFEILISNSIKYKSDAPPIIKITSKDDGGRFLFTVEDNGAGIPQTHLERVFTMFQRLHRKEEIPGTGVGLSIARKIVEMHEGKIWIESTGENGCRVFFTIKKNAN